MDSLEGDHIQHIGSVIFYGEVEQKRKFLGIGAIIRCAVMLTILLRVHMATTTLTR
jgi:hypothetical protein